MTEQDVRFGSDGCSFAGTCLEAEYPTTAALLITGSGKTGRVGGGVLAWQTRQAVGTLPASTRLILRRHWDLAPAPAADQRETR